MTDLCGKSVLANFIHAPERHQMDVLENTLVTLDHDGMIVRVTLSDEDGYADAVEAARKSHSLVEIPRSQYIIPGFVDLHIHAPQWPQLGKALDVPLEVWLQEHTFPLEARYADTAFAERVYADLVKNLLANGTTTAVYFGTIHQKANRVLADTCFHFGQRAVIGKVAMDNPGECPDYYRDASAEASISGTRDFIDYVRAIPGNENGLIAPAITPASFQAAQMKRWMGWAKWRRKPNAMFKPIALKAIGSMTTF